jgi:hypothetical protein
MLLGLVGAKLAVYQLGGHGMELGCDIRWHCVVLSMVEELADPICGCCKGSPKHGQGQAGYLVVAPLYLCQSHLPFCTGGVGLWTRIGELDAEGLCHGHHLDAAHPLRRGVWGRLPHRQQAALCEVQVLA